MPPSNVGDLARFFGKSHYINTNQVYSIAAIRAWAASWYVELDGVPNRQFPLVEFESVVKQPDWPAKALEVLTAASGHSTADTLIVMQNLRKAGYVLVPVDVPEAALGEVMTWIGCEDPHLVFEAVNSMLNILGIEWPDDPTAMENLRRLGASEMTMKEWEAYKASTQC